MIKLTKTSETRICQGDIFKDIEYIEYAIEKDGVFEISKILFPYVIVLTQDCDLEQDFNCRNKANSSDKSDHDKQLISVLVAPLYNTEHVYEGTHLEKLSLNMQKIKKDRSPGKYLKNNQRERYHSLQFDNDASIPNSVIDFKHYFSVNIEALSIKKKTNFIGKVPALFRERISQRFSNFLSRIGLPAPKATTHS